MKCKKIPVLMILGFLVLGFVSFGVSIKSQAASDYNLIQTVSSKKVKSGTWKRNSKGWWYQYKNGKYPKKVWAKINGDIYYFNKKGYMVTGKKTFKGNLYFLRNAKKNQGALWTGWKNLGGKRYYFSETTGAAVKGWQTIGDEKYHFNHKGILSKNCTVDNIKLGADGTVIMPNDSNAGAGTAARKKAKLVFVGDSRTVGMQNTVGGNAEYIGKVGEGYFWFSNTAIKNLKKILNQYPASDVVLNFGINDLGNIANYINYYRGLIASYPDAEFHLASVNPVEEKLAKTIGYTVKNAQIEAFNLQMKAAFPNHYIDSYGYLKRNGYIVSKGKSTVDGIHYTATAYSGIYNFITQEIAD